MQSETEIKQSQMPEGGSASATEQKSDDSKSNPANQSSDSKDTASDDNVNLLKEKEEMVQQQAEKIKELEVHSIV